ncbi:membrane protein [Sporomusaceae bacterium FL31]|nr:membrane protein [Sporomusaceae bacterium FL31]GCE32430.1 membrane protein [Sporomusaceae bacterium]
MDYFVGLISIITINIVLSGDNALVIALASRNLSGKRRKYAVILGGAGAIILRILLTFMAIYLLKIPYLQLLAGLLLLWIAVKLVRQEAEHENVKATANLGEAIRTIIAADLVMSLDNVIAIAGVAKGNITLLAIGLAISIPIIIWGSKLINVLIVRWPIIIIVGAAFLGWTAGDMVGSEQKLSSILAEVPWGTEAISMAFAAFVLVMNTVSAKKKIH